MRNVLLLCYILFINVYGQIIWNGQGHIPQSSQVDWTNAGLLPNTPTVADNFFDVTDPAYGAFKLSTVIEVSISTSYRVKTWLL